MKKIINENDLTQNFLSHNKEDNNKNKIDNNENTEKINFINDFYAKEEKKNYPKQINGKITFSINDIIGEEAKQPIKIQMIDTFIKNFSKSKISSRSFGVIKSYAVNTNQGIARDYNEDRVSIVINMNKPDYYTSTLPWTKLSYFGIFDGHAGNKCADFLRDNLLQYIIDNSYFPEDIPNAIKFAFKKIDEDYLKNYAFKDDILVDNSGSCGLILLIIKNKIYIGNVGDSRCLGSFKNGSIQKDITIDHKPNFPDEKKRIIDNGGSIYQTQSPIENDELYKNKILIGPYRVSPGKLSVSRTVGDAEGKIEKIGGNKNVLISFPDIFEFNLDKDDIDFFILGCDGIYEQLKSKEVLDCAWKTINNNIKFIEKNKKDKNIKNSFKGNYGNEIDMNTTSGNIIDFILKASMLRKSFDNVTCLFISFKNFFENNENPNKENKENNNKINNIHNKKLGLKDLLFGNRYNIETNQENKESLSIPKKEKQEINIPKEIKKEENINKNESYINKNGEEELISDRKKLTKNITDSNLIDSNNKPKLENNINRSLSFNKKKKKENKQKKLKNKFSEIYLPKNISSTNFFSKTHYFGFNTNHNNKLRINKKTNNNQNQNEDYYRHTSYNKNIRKLYIENSNKNGPKKINSKIINPKLPKIIDNSISNYNNKSKLNNESNTQINLSNNLSDIRSSSYNNKDEKFKSKNHKINLTKEKYFQHKKIKMKFNNIIKENNVGNKINDINIHKIEIDNDNNKKEIPSLTDNVNLNIYKNNLNKLNENKLKKYFSKIKMKRNSNLQDKKKYFYGDYKVQINISNINIFGAQNKSNINNTNFKNK